MNSGTTRTIAKSLCLCRRTWNSARPYQLICAHHNVLLLPAGRPWTHSSEVPLVEEVSNNSADGKAYLCLSIWIQYCIFTASLCQNIHRMYIITLLALCCRPNIEKLVSFTSLSQIKYILVVLSQGVVKNGHHKCCERRISKL